MSEETGIVRLEDLSKKEAYIELEELSCIAIKNKIKQHLGCFQIRL